MYEPSIVYKRTPAERADQMLSWQRDDKAFFAAGACHILAWAFIQTYPEAGFSVLALRKVGEPHPSHIYVTDGTWAFDHCGWTLEEELLAVTRSSEPDCEFERLLITCDLETFCADNYHRLPGQFAFLPWQRAFDYISRFNLSSHRRCHGVSTAR